MIKQYTYQSVLLDLRCGMMCDDVRTLAMGDGHGSGCDEPIAIQDPSSIAINEKGKYTFSTV